jgi:hypothetical protein
MDTIIAILALLVSVIALGISFHFWRRQFRPIVTAAVKTASAGNEAIAYNLVILNSGTIPAKNISLKLDETTLPAALGGDATAENRTRWLACFSLKSNISVLHNGACASCSFGTTRSCDRGFWKVRGQISIVIKYEGWFGSKYEQPQTIEIVDSGSFTGYQWGNNNG